MAERATTTHVCPGASTITNLALHKVVVGFLNSHSTPPATVMLPRTCRLLFAMLILLFLLYKSEAHARARMRQDRINLCMGYNIGPG